MTFEVELKNRLGHGALSFTLASKQGTHQVLRETGSWNWRRSELGRIAYERDPKGRVELDGSKLRRLRIGSQVRAEEPEELFLRQLEAREFRGLVNALGSFEGLAR
jgi:hypothetical protein